MRTFLRTRAGFTAQLIFLMTVFLLLLGQVAFAQSASENDQAAAWQMLEMVNEWRVSEGLWPLKPNTTLEAMAIAQATHVLPNIENIDDEALFHTDADGRNPRERAAAAPYNWPSYGQLQQIEVGENAGVGSHTFALNFWKNSEIHRRAALSAVYREVGIAALPSKTGYLFMMDFGARPGVLTALLNSSGGTLYLSSENSKYTGVTPGNMQVRIFDADGRALTGTQPWTPTINFEQRLSGEIFVLFTNSTYQALTPVNVEQDFAVLPGSAPAVVEEPALVALATQVPPTAVPALPTAAAPLAQFAFPTNTPNAPALVASAAPAAADLLALYTDHALVIFNNVPTAVNLSGLSIGGANRLSVERWQTVASFPIDAFPSGSCLMVSEAGSSPATPSNCKFVRSQLEVSASRAFWKLEPFTINRGDSILATCQPGAGQCAVDLP
jgi:uncharacterized protein YkwD